jgi:hypothetical protein
MKLKVSISILFLALLMQSCIRSEAPNTEAAIDGCKGKDVQTAVINYNSKEVDIYITATANTKELQLTFVIPAGASIYPKETVSGDGQNTEGLPIYNFSQSASLSRYFTVTSEDKVRSVDYLVKLISTGFPTDFSFETLKQEKPYHILQDFNAKTGEVLNWASGNEGFKMTGILGGAIAVEDYPTMQSTSGYKGKCAKLTTRSTGSLGTGLGMPIAAGNLFIGNFDVSGDILSPTKAPKATKFGVQFYRHPTLLKGYYKYKAGSSYTNENNQVVPDKKDRFDIYAIMYEASTPDFMLDGFWSTSEPSLVSIARIAENDAEESDTWKAFSIPFIPVSGKSIDEQKLKDGKYKLAIVFSSSVEGAFFKGAIGSTLYIDEVTLEYQEQQAEN